MAEGGPSLGVKYCGGCNPRYDRTAFVRRLETEFPAVSFVPAGEGFSGPLLVVCGCAARCAGLNGLSACERRFVVCGEGDLAGAEAFVEQEIHSKEVSL